MDKGLDKIILILPYFGKFNNYFHLWLKSVEYNPTIDFLLVTDNQLEKVPRNVEVVNMTFDKLRELTQACFDFEICLPNPYKLCDYKPFYYKIFKDYYSEGYDFSGYCDNDLIFGDIRSFFSSDILQEYNSILTRGHLKLARFGKLNDELIIQDVSGSLSCKDVLSRSESFAYDEWGGTKVIDGKEIKVCGVSGMWQLNYPQDVYDEIIFDDISTDSKEFISFQKNLLEEDKYKLYSIFIFDKGKLYRSYIKGGKVCKEETAYVHLQKRKMNVKLSSKEAPDQFMIVPNNFIDFKENPSYLYHLWHGHKRLYYADKQSLKFEGYVYAVKEWLKQTIYTLRYKRRP